MGKFMAVLFLVSGATFAWEIYSDPYFRSNSGPRPYKDYWGNSYKYYDNLWKDTDGDGVINYYDYNDRDPDVWTPYQRGIRGWGW